MAAQNEIGGKFTIDIEDLKNGISQANRLMRLADSEFKAAAAGLGNWADSAEGLTAKQKQLNTAIDLQNAKISALEQEYSRVSAAQGENSSAATNLKIRINNETAAREKNRAELEKVSSALDELEKNADDAADSSGKLADKEKEAAKAGKDAGSSAESFGSKAKAAAIGGVKALATAAAGLVTAFMGSAEATREYRTEMGKLEAAFTTAGHTTEAAKKTYEELYAFMGEEDTAVEAANHLAQLVENEKDLASWTNIATGVFATFGDSLPIEGLTEAANETAKVGQVTGPLADALNWAGVSEDEFNAKLEKCSSEQERQALITSTLNGLYADASKKYKDLNKDVMDANTAQSMFNDSMAKVGEMAEPVMTILKTKAAEALNAVTNLFSGFNDLIHGETSFAEFGSQVMNKIVQSIKNGAPKMAQAAFALMQNLSIGIRNNFSNLIKTALGVTEKLTDKIRESEPEFIKAGLQMIQNLVKGLMDALPTLIAKIPTIVSNIAGVINDNAPIILKAAANIVLTLIKGIVSAIPTLVQNIPKILKAIVDVWTAFNWANLGKSAITALGNGIKGLFGWIKGIGASAKDNIVDAIKALPGQLKNLGKTAITNMGSAISGAKSTITSAAKKVYLAAVDGIKGLPKEMVSIGKNLVKGLWNGISDMTGWVIGKIQGFGDSVLGSIKDFFGIASPSKVMKEVIGKNIVAGIAAGITENKKVATNVIKKFGDELLTVLEKRLANYKVYHTMSLQEEVTYWNNARKLFKKGTQDRIDADQKYYEAKTNLNEQLKTAEETYTKSVAEAYANLKSSVASVIEEYEKEVQSRANAIAGSMSLFEAFNKQTEQTGTELIANLQSQVSALQQWIAALDELENKGIDSNFVQYLRELGVGSAAQVDLLNNMTATELDKYVALWQDKNNLARQAATNELSQLQQETILKITNLTAETQTAISGYNKVYDDALKKLGVAVKKQVTDTDKVLTNTAADTILKTAPKVGKDTINGIIAGLDAQSGALYARISSIISSAIAAAQAAAEIASPSKIMRDLIGKNLIKGAIVGIEAESSNLYTTMRSVVDNTIGAAQNNATIDQPAHMGGTVVYFTQNNNSPKALSPYEVYRQTKIANRMMLEGR